MPREGGSVTSEIDRKRLIFCLLTAVLFAAVAGCADTTTVRLYPGGARPKPQIARVYNTERAALIYVDQRKVHEAFRASKPPGYIYELEPGRYRARVARLEGRTNWHDRPDVTAWFTYEFTAGRQYSFVTSDFIGGDGKLVWKVWLIDYDSGEVLAAPDGATYRESDAPAAPAVPKRRNAEVVCGTN
jgi:hypothetical protein